MILTSYVYKVKVSNRNSFQFTTEDDYSIGYVEKNSEVKYVFIFTRKLGESYTGYKPEKIRGLFTIIGGPIHPKEFKEFFTEYSKNYNHIENLKDL